MINKNIHKFCILYKELYDLEKMYKPVCGNNNCDDECKDYDKCNIHSGIRDIINNLNNEFDCYSTCLDNIKKYHGIENINEQCGE